jgi:hypothetical protein
MINPPPTLLTGDWLVGLFSHWPLSHEGPLSAVYVTVSESALVATRRPCFVESRTLTLKV